MCPVRVRALVTVVYFAAAHLCRRSLWRQTARVWVGFSPNHCFVSHFIQPDLLGSYTINAFESHKYYGFSVCFPKYFYFSCKPQDTLKFNVTVSCEYKINYTGMDWIPCKSRLAFTTRSRVNYDTLYLPWEIGACSTNIQIFLPYNMPRGGGGYKDVLASLFFCGNRFSSS